MSEHLIDKNALSTEEQELYTRQFADLEEEEVIWLLQDWQNEGGCVAACEKGCWIEADGKCQHKKPSWLRVFGIVPTGDLKKCYISAALRDSPLLLSVTAKS